MAHRDFAARRGANKNKKTKSANKNILIGVALTVLLAFGVGLYFLKHKTEDKVQSVAVQADKIQPKSQLPNRPEEVWSYIKALETRTVPVDDKPASIEKNMRLTEEQRQVLVQMEKEQKAAEAARKLAEQQRAEQQKAEAAKAEQAKKVEQAKPAEVKKVEQVKVEPAKKPEQNKTEPVKKPEPAKVETAKKAEPTKPAENKGKKFGLQCGAFKNRAQAENLQGRLAMAGLNAFVVQNGEWHRVRIGGFDNRDLAAQAQSKAKSVEDCVIIGM